MVLNSTEYYRKNRLTKRVVYKCPHCNYQTNNSKIQLINHINAKHVSEKNKPFQCNHCNRGFAQKAHLVQHLSIVHNIETKKPKISSISYIINVTNNIPNSRKTMARCKYYRENKIINSDELNNKKHEYLDGIFLKASNIHYDAQKEFITLKKCTIHESNCRCVIKMPNLFRILSTSNKQ
jgi:hypothetical protein